LRRREGFRMTFSPVNVSNNILRRAFDESVSVSPMKLQKLLYFVASEYGKRADAPLLAETFQPWKYGPVVRSVYDEFRSFGGGPIRAYGKDAQGKAYMADERQDSHLARALDDVWRAAKSRSAVELSRITHLPGSAWDRAYREHRWIDAADIAADKTYEPMLGLGTR
jgi:uncharacterized phage-associated protein